MNSRFSVCLAALSLSLSLPAGAVTLFTSSFDGNTGATVLAGNTDNVSGSASVTINDWTTDPSVTSISGLTAISTDNGTSAGGFAQLQGGTAAYANSNNIFLSRNSFNQGAAPRNRGFGMTFTLDTAWDLATLTILAGHTNNTGAQDQAFASDLRYSLSGGTLGAAVNGVSTEDQSVAPAYHTVNFNLTGTTLGAGTYTLSVYETNATGGSYAIYDGISLTATPVPEPTVAVLGSLGLLGLGRRRR